MGSGNTESFDGAIVVDGSQGKARYDMILIGQGTISPATVLTVHSTYWCGAL
jgi:hypothetical protein